MCLVCVCQCRSLVYTLSRERQATLQRISKPRAGQGAMLGTIDTGSKVQCVTWNYTIDDDDDDHGVSIGSVDDGAVRRELALFLSCSLARSCR